MTFSYNFKKILSYAIVYNAFELFYSILYNVFIVYFYGILYCLFIIFSWHISKRNVV